MPERIKAISQGKLPASPGTAFLARSSGRCWRFRITEKQSRKELGGQISVSLKTQDLGRAQEIRDLCIARLHREGRLSELTVERAVRFGCLRIGD